MQCVDVAVIGGGVLGCFVARNLLRWKVKVALLEASASVCTGISKANSGICYAGYDHAPGSLKASFTVDANAAMEGLCEELEVPFLRPGGLMTATGPDGQAVLRKKFLQGNEKKVPGLRLVSGEEAREMEPMLGNNVVEALYSPTTGILNPWQLGIAAFENAVENGCTPFLNCSLLGIRRAGNNYILQTNGEELACRSVINCAGLYADRVREMLFPPEIRLFMTASDYLVMDRRAEAPQHVLFEQTENEGKGVTAIPTTEGNLLLESAARPLEGGFFSTAPEGLAQLRAGAKEYLPGLDLSKVIRSYGAVRPNPFHVVNENGVWVPDGRSIGSFVIEEAEPGFISALGIKTPGLTCADLIGLHLAGRVADYLSAEKNASFIPHRRGIVRLSHLPFEVRRQTVEKNPAYGEIVCHCEDITRGEILEAIRRGASSVEEIKRYLGTGMGPCQGSRCTRRIESLLRNRNNG